MKTRILALLLALALPAEGTDAADYAAGLTGERLAAALANADPAADVFAVLPKFTANGSYTLNGALAAMGMADAFDAGRADFSAMGHYGDLPLYIGLVLHKTELVLDERGTKAGAATAVLMEAGGAMVEHEVHDVVCDRPFVYLLLDTEWDIPLFIGTVETLAG